MEELLTEQGTVDIAHHRANVTGGVCGGWVGGWVGGWSWVEKYEEAVLAYWVE